MALSKGLFCKVQQLVKDRVDFEKRAKKLSTSIETQRDSTSQNKVFNGNLKITIPSLLLEKEIRANLTGMYRCTKISNCHMVNVTKRIQINLTIGYLYGEYW